MQSGKKNGRSARAQYTAAKVGLGAGNCWPPATAIAAVTATFILHGCKLAVQQRKRVPFSFLVTTEATVYVGMELGIYRLLSTNAWTTSLFFSGSLFSGFYGQCPLKLCITGMLARNMDKDDID